MAYLAFISLTTHVLILLALSVCLVYCLVILGFTYGWRNIREYPDVVRSSEVMLSVIIAARNEDKNLPLLIQDLEKQSYPRHLFEIIIVDDHSEVPPGSSEPVKNNSLNNLRVLNLPDEYAGKKQALIFGARHSNYDHLLFTDADCRLPPKWVESFASFIGTDPSDLIIGLVDQEHEKRPDRIFFRLDFLSLIISGAGAAQLNHPVFCNGANLFVKKDLFLDNAQKLNLRYKSGDDVFLLHAIKHADKSRIHVLKNQASLVRTKGPPNISQFFKQRRRWASKSTAYKDPDTILLALLIMLTNLILLLALGTAISAGKYFLVVLLMYALKGMADFALLHTGLNFFGHKMDLGFMPLFTLLYPLYIVTTALSGIFMPSRWKQR